MRNTLVGVLAVVVIASAMSFADSYTDTAATDNYGKIGLKKLTADIDANFALVEAGNVKSAASSMTNNAVLTLSSAVHKLTGIGQEAGETNLITFSSPWTADRLFVVTVDKGSTNDIKIADSGALVALGADLVLEPTDAAVFLTTSTTTMVKVAVSGSN